MIKTTFKLMTINRWRWVQICALFFFISSCMLSSGVEESVGGGITLEETVSTSSISGSGPVLANGVNTSTITITLKDSGGNGVEGLVPTFSATDTGSGNTYGTCSTSDSSGVSTCTLKSTTAESKTLTLTYPTTVVGSTAVVFTSAGLDLVVPIEMVDFPCASSTTSTVTFLKSRTGLTTTDYDGTVSYVWEIVGANVEGGASYNVTLIDSAGVTKGTINLSNASEFLQTRKQVSFTPNAGTDNYRIVIPQTAALNAAVRVFSSRIIVIQTDATKTNLYFPMTTANYGSYSGNNANPILSTTSTSFTAPSPVLVADFGRDDSEYATIDSGTAWTFDAVISSDNASGIAYAALHDASSGTMVAGSEVSSAGTAVSRVTSSFADSASWATGKKYTLKIKSNNALYTTRLMKSGLWLKLTNLTKAHIYNRIGSARTAVTTTSWFGGYRHLFRGTTAYSNPVHYLEGDGSTTNANGNCLIYFDDVGPGDSGSGAAPYESNISFNTSKARTRTSSFSITNNDRTLVLSEVNNGDTCDYISPFWVVKITQ